MPSTPAEQIVWIDCEMTGLDVDRDGLCEIAVIVTDFELNPLDPGFEIVIDPGSEALEHMNDFVREMHTSSGLLPRIEGAASTEQAEEQVIAYLKRFVTPGKRPLVAGNTIGMDRRFIAKYMPKLEELLHYRSIDVSTIKELSRRWYPAAYFEAPAKQGGHRALADIAESIRELAYFRDLVLVPTPGPGKPEAEAAAGAASERFAALIEGPADPEAASAEAEV